jgi:tight adherence protein C
MGSALTYFLALVFGFGILLVWSSVFVPKRVRQVGLAGDLEEIDYSPDVEGRRRLSILGEKSLLGRAFGPLIAGWADQAMGLLNRAETDRKKLMMAGWPKPWHTVEDFYASKVLAGGLLGAMGIAAGLMAAPEAVFVLVPALALVGFFIPDLSLNSQAKKRREMIVAEMASVPDRIAIQVQSGKTLALAIRAISERPGGPLVQELRKVSADYAVDGDLAGAMEKMAERSGLPELRDFVGRVRLALEQGTAIAPLLQVMGASARERLNLMLEQRALRNSFLMIIPIGGLVLPAVLVMLGAPGFSLFLGSGPGF